MKAFIKSPLLGQRHSAFTLIEMLMVLAVSAILLTIAAPNFRTLLQGQQVSAATSDLLASIVLTRSEAIARGTRVDLVPLSDDGNWAKGWVVFIDQNDNQRVDAGEKVIYSHSPLAPGINIVSNLNDSSRNYLAYSSAGRTRTNAGSQTPQAGSITIAADSARRKIVINFLGRPRACDPAKDALNC